MTLAELHAALDGFIESKGGRKPAAPSEDEFLAALVEEMAAGRA